MIFTKGDTIKNTLNKTQHIVDCCETHDDITVVFTEDKKCFPISEVEKFVPLTLGDIFSKMLQGEKITKEESDFLDEKLSKMYGGK